MLVTDGLLEAVVDLHIPLRSTLWVGFVRKSAAGEGKGESNKESDSVGSRSWTPLSLPGSPVAGIDTLSAAAASASKAAVAGALVRDNADADRTGGDFETVFGDVCRATFSAAFGPFCSGLEADLDI